MTVARESDLTRLGTLGGALGDPTRFAIYRQVISARDPLSATEIAEVIGLHRTVARSHLEKLVQAGLLRSGTRRKAGGGRPAKTYSLSEDRLEIQLPPRAYETLSLLLVRLLSRFNGQATDLARETGWEYGRELAASLPRQPGSNRPEFEVILAALVERGCSPSVVERTPRRIVLEVNNCLYQEMAGLSPELVCALSIGTICGLVGVQPGAHRQMRSITNGDEVCRHEFLL
jgi:predicted ArsR family transcriptional regulator